MGEARPFCGWLAVFRTVWREVEHCYGGEESNQGLVRMGWVVVIFQLKCVCVALC